MPNKTYLGDIMAIRFPGYCEKKPAKEGPAKVTVKRWNPRRPNRSNLRKFYETVNPILAGYGCDMETQTIITRVMAWIKEEGYDRSTTP